MSYKTLEIFIIRTHFQSLELRVTHRAQTCAPACVSSLLTDFSKNSHFIDVKFPPASSGTSGDAAVPSSR